MRVVITGGSGQLAMCLVSTAPHGIEAIPLTKVECDVTDREMLRAAIERWRPRVIINAAAYTAVDRAEANFDAASAVNAVGAGNVAVAAEFAGAALLHISTDFVFDGSVTVPYSPDSPTAPINAYGQSKLEGERAVMRANSQACIVRTSWLYSPYGSNFLKTMIRKLQGSAPVRVVADQYGSPTSALSLSKVLWVLVVSRINRGIFHWCDAGMTSWYEFAQEIQRQGLETGLLRSRVSLVPIDSSQYQSAANRPKYSVLDCSSTTALTGIVPQPWSIELGTVLRALV